MQRHGNVETVLGKTGWMGCVVSSAKVKECSERPLNKCDQDLGLWHIANNNVGTKALPFTFEMRGNSADSWLGAGIELAMELGISLNYKN